MQNPYSAGGAPFVPGCAFPPAAVPPPAAAAATSTKRPREEGTEQSLNTVVSLDSRLKLLREYKKLKQDNLSDNEIVSFLPELESFINKIHVSNQKGGSEEEGEVLV